MRTRTRRHDSGSAMVMAAIAFILMAGIGAALFSMSISASRIALRGGRRARPAAPIRHQE